MKKTTFPFFKSIFTLFLMMSATGFAQNVDVILTVDWPQWSTENRVEFYDPNDMLLVTIDNGFDGSGAAANPYNETTTAVSYPVNSSTTAGYYVIVYDTYGDGWNQAGSLTITADGDTALSFNGTFDTSATNSQISQTIYFAIEEAAPPPPPFPGVSQFDTSGNNYIEYIPGNMPIIISAPHGGVLQSGETIGGTFYPDNDSALPDRNCGGTNERDDNTDILIREIQESVFDQTGCYPYIIINNLHRSKLDPNRESTEATCSDADALFYWNAYHNFVDTASAEVMSTYGKGLYIDLHGQSHSIPRIEAGYNISATDLNNTTANYLNTVSNSTITNLVSNNLGGLTQEELVRGPNSLGGIFRDTGGVFYNAQGYSGCSVTSGYRTLPSDFNGGTNACNDTRPLTNAYFAGDFYSNMRHGSGPAASDALGGGGTIDGIMTEVNRRVRDLGTYNGNVYDTRPQTLVPFADDYGIVIKNYIDLHYNDFATFAFPLSTYATGDPDPTPTKTAGVTGVFTATPAGLSINPTTGVIDLSMSTDGLYTITHTVGACDLYTATSMMTITNTLSTPTFEDASFAMYPNPTSGKLQIESTQTISKVIVYNLIGQQVKTFDMQADQTSIDISELKTGSYFVNVQSTSGNTYTKLVVKK
jgi:hypothetical protein